VRPGGDPRRRPRSRRRRTEELARPRGVEVETQAGVRHFGGGREEVPKIVSSLVAAGDQVYGVCVLRSTLEDVYLEAVGGSTG